MLLFVFKALNGLSPCYITYSLIILHKPWDPTSLSLKLSPRLPYKPLGMLLLATMPPQNIAHFALDLLTQWTFLNYKLVLPTTSSVFLFWKCVDPVFFLLLSALPPGVYVCFGGYFVFVAELWSILSCNLCMKCLHKKSSFIHSFIQGDRKGVRGCMSPDRLQRRDCRKGTQPARHPVVPVLLTVPFPLTVLNHTFLICSVILSIKQMI